MHKETLRFHKGLRAIVLPDGRRLSSDQKRVFVEPPQSLQRTAAQQASTSKARSSRRSVTQSAPNNTRNIHAPDGKTAVPVGPAAVGHKTTQTSSVPAESTAPTKQQQEVALQEALQALRVRVEPLLSQISENMNEFVATQKAQLQELEKPTLEVAMCIAEHVVGQCVDSNQLNVQPLISNALRHFAGSEKVQVKLNTEDLAALQATGVDLESLGDQVSLVSDPSLPVGSCLVAGDGHQMASTVRQRLDNARRYVMEEFQHDRD